VVLVSLRGGSSSAGFTNQTKKNRGRRFSSGSAPAAAGTYQSPPAEYVGPPPLPCRRMALPLFTGLVTLVRGREF